MKGEEPTRPDRSFGVILHTFPEMTPTEKAFVGVFGICGLVAAVEVGRSKISTDVDIAAFCLCLMGSVLGYWLKQEPEALLQLLLLFPLIGYTGYRVKWPRVVLMGLRAFGAAIFVQCLAAFPLAVFPESWWMSPWVSLLVLALVVGISVRALRKRSGPAAPQT